MTDSYEPFLWASEWHTHFSESDVRREFGWRGRFGPLPTAYNFFSSSENVLKDGDGKGVTLIGDFFSLWQGDHAWYAQPFFEEFGWEDATFAEPYDTTGGAGGSPYLFRGEDFYGQDGQAPVNGLNSDGALHGTSEDARRGHPGGVLCDGGECG